MDIGGIWIIHIVRFSSWGLNVVDATVDAHLKGFDISEDLSLKLKPTILSGGSTAGLSLVLTIGKNKSYRKNSYALK